MRTVDCWQLDAEELTQAQKSGQCDDAFARNGHEIVPLPALNRPRSGRPALLPAEAPAKPVEEKKKTKKQKSNPNPKPTAIAGGP
ncbi:MAG TPA: hypothetical protein VD978_00740 [Azospirillum sp.]|nr:hypothetical protein [Azospirillum sp.]